MRPVFDTLAQPRAYILGNSGPSPKSTVVQPEKHCKGDNSQCLSYDLYDLTHEFMSNVNDFH